MADRSGVTGGARSTCPDCEAGFTKGPRPSVSGPLSPQGGSRPAGVATALQPKESTIWGSDGSALRQPEPFAMLRPGPPDELEVVVPEGLAGSIQPVHVVQRRDAELGLDRGVRAPGGEIRSAPVVGVDEVAGQG